MPPFAVLLELFGVAQLLEADWELVEAVVLLDTDEDDEEVLLAILELVLLPPVLFCDELAAAAAAAAAFKDLAVAKDWAALA